MERLAAHTGVQADWQPLQQEIDGEIHLHFNGINVNAFAEIKKELRGYQLPAIIEMAERYHPFMVIADQIFPILKETLRQKKIGYLDGAGNIYFQAEGNFIWMDGNKRLAAEKPVTNRAFTKTGLKAVFYLLANPGAINMPYRTLAEATGVALGNVKNIVEGLRDAGYIAQVNKGTLALQNKKALLDRWVTGYREILKPALHTGNYRLWDNTKLRDWQALPVQAGEGAWGGETAAEQLTNHLIPEILTFYTNEHKGLFIPRWKLVPDENGNVRLYKKFWADGDAGIQLYAPPLLVYADLMLVDDPRCREAAEMIYTKYLEHELQ